ncbi:hypothetical protein SPBR_00505 [Sporothrix brasiliensis 5110]|uniref:DUF1237 domain protein n=1 Tax=Sporothrix brasiliensis 5110 TaxID=1398154 RepID=A0A0C2FHA0_9PEZI|nr:uncharacterized protein SPBR_00505 [Sporothrix brasiliensis 5110]KIH90473.1 hypothetical protein SPBR_00505 [Sporothrix brasiliensis 5110]
MTRRSKIAGAGVLAGLWTAGTAVGQSCPDYSTYAMNAHAPLSNGSYQLGYMRPDPACRTFNLTEVESTITSMARSISDPDLYRLFVNAFPNTLDTAIRWKGVAAENADEELTFVITGDIDAMWLRDSSNQMQSYRSLLKASSDPNSLASLYRGVINLQARYLLESPYCNSFQPPVESGIAPATNGAAKDDTVTPPYDSTKVFECKYELDSLAAFLEVSSDYFTATGDTAFFGKFKWLQALQAVLQTATSMMTPTYGDNGTVLTSPYTFTRMTTRSTETLANNGLGSPVAANTGLIRSAFRPSDDSTLLQLFIPANMMFSHYLEQTAKIVDKLGSAAPKGLGAQMHSLASSLRNAILRHGIVADTRAGTVGAPVYAYEVDGYGSSIIMDDANIPSLLSAPFFGFTSISDPVYQSTRAAILSETPRPGPSQYNSNPYFMHGPVISGVGGPHQGPGYAWPMASIVRILTSDDDDEIVDQLHTLVSSTSGLGLIHESVNTFDQSKWTRQWFSWANGLFGQMMLDLKERKPSLLKRSYQP